MKKRLNNEHGLTLAELLATLVIGSLIIILIMSAFIFVQKQFTTQKGNLQENTDISIALKSITRDARAADKFIIKNASTLILEIIDDDDITYSLENNILKRNNTNYIYDINNFKVTREEMSGEVSKFTVTIESNSNKNISTEIVKRGEIIDEENKNDEK